VDMVKGEIKFITSGEGGAKKPLLSIRGRRHKRGGKRKNILLVLSGKRKLLAGRAKRENALLERIWKGE